MVWLQTPYWPPSGKTNSGDFEVRPLGHLLATMPDLLATRGFSLARRHCSDVLGLQGRTLGPR